MALIRAMEIGQLPSFSLLRRGCISKILKVEKQVSKRFDFCTITDRSFSANIERAFSFSWFSFQDRPKLRARFLNELDAYSRGHDEDDADELAETVGKFEYYALRPEGCNNAVHYRRPAPLPGVRSTASPRSQQRSRVGQNARADANVAGEVKVLDLNEVASETGFASVGVMRLSPDPDATLLAYTVDTSGSEEYELRIVRVETDGQMFERVGMRPYRDGVDDGVIERIPGAVGAAWAPYNPGQPLRLYYTLADKKSLRANVVKCHTIGTDHSRDKLVLTEPDASRYLDVVASKDGQMVTISSNGRDASSVFILEYSCVEEAIPEGVSSEGAGHTRMHTCTPPLRLLPSPPPYAPPLQYFVEHVGGGHVLIVHNNGCDDFQVSCVHVQVAGADSGMPTQAAWLPCHPGVCIDDVDVFSLSYKRDGSGGGNGGHVVVYERYNGKPRIRILRYSEQGGCPVVQKTSIVDEFVPLPPGTVRIIPGANADPSATILRFGVATATGPMSDYEYDFRTQSVALLRARHVGAVPGLPLFLPSAYTTYTLHAPSLDGTLVPVTIVHRADERMGVDVEQVQARAAALVAAAAGTPVSYRDSVCAWAAGDPWPRWQGSSEAYAKIAARDVLVNACMGKDDWRVVGPNEEVTSVSTITFMQGMAAGVRRLVSAPSPPFPSLTGGGRAAPCLLHAYGAYGQPMETDFSPRRLPLLVRGWIAAFAHVRGGGDLGRSWYTSGRGQSKLASMLDTVAVARMLIAVGLTRSSMLAMKTASAGCLLSGWLCNTHPGLIRAHIMCSPFLDPLGAMRDPAQALTEAEYPEWGNPAASRQDEVYLASYSPSTQLALSLRKAGVGFPTARRNTGADVWPAMLIKSALDDPRTPFDPILAYLSAIRTAAGHSVSVSGSRAGGGSEHRKSARGPGFRPTNEECRAATDKRPTLICEVNENGGHFGAAGRLGSLTESAHELVFLHEILRLDSGAVLS